MYIVLSFHILFTETLEKVVDTKRDIMKDIVWVHSSDIGVLERI